MQKNEIDVCKTLKVFGILLCYPSLEIIKDSNVLLDILKEEKLLTPKNLHNVEVFIQYMVNNDLLTLQEKYVELFDRNRSISLHLFEHVHGESRERGEAMLSLLDIYNEYGFSAIENELPDYIPLFLEFLSCIPKNEAFEMLDDPKHIFIAIEKRLKQYNSEYYAIFMALCSLCNPGNDPKISIITEDNSVAKLHAKTFAELDKEWEDLPVNFMGVQAPDAVTTEGCGSGKCGNCSDK